MIKNVFSGGCTARVGIGASLVPEKAADRLFL
jgi:hypothetical protein